MSNNESNLPAKGDESRSSVRLHDNGLRAGNLIDSAISRLDDSQVQALGVKAAEAALELQKRQTQQNIDYVTGKKVVEDHIDTWDALNKQGKTTRQSVTTDVETGAGRMRIESKSGATCFVATAAYENPHHPDVVFLRWYRDTILVKSTAGQQFIRSYWKIGPYFANIISPHPRIRFLVKVFLSKLVNLLRRLYAKNF